MFWGLELAAGQSTKIEGKQGYDTLMITNIAAATGKCFIKVNNQLIGAVDANKIGQLKVDLKINPLSKNTLSAEGNGKVSFSGYWGNNQGIDSDQSDDEEVNDAVAVAQLLQREDKQHDDKMMDSVFEKAKNNIEKRLAKEKVPEPQPSKSSIKKAKREALKAQEALEAAKSTGSIEKTKQVKEAKPTKQVAETKVVKQTTQVKSQPKAIGKTEESKKEKKEKKVKVVKEAVVYDSKKWDELDWSDQELKNKQATNNKKIKK